MADSVGRTILHYRIIEQVGQGGMGIVYKAEDTKLERTVALKFLSLTSIGDEEKKRFKREAKAAASLNHPNIATVFAIDEVDDQTFIAMEFIEGTPLNPSLARGDIGGSKPLPLDKAIDYATQIAAGLQAAHEKGIVHRDIKSANIMVTDKGQIKIMDFGLAKLAHRSKMTQLGTTLGTAAYMSPEQARGESVDHRSDIWSLGVVLYEMISGQMPFKGDYEQAVIYSIQNEEPEPLTAVRSGLPIALDGIIAKALAKDPATRYQHVDELPADLKALDTVSLSRSRITKTQRFPADRPKSARQLKALIPWAIAVVLGIGLAISLSLLITTKLPNPPLPLTSSLVFEEGAGPAVGSGRNLSISPDGTQLAYVTLGSFDGGRLWIRDLADGSMRPLTGTEGAVRPFWSPDGSMLGYFAEQELRVVPAKGGPSIVIASAPLPSGGAWNARGAIIYNPADGPLFKVPSAGGTPKQLTQLTKQGGGHRSPVFMPDGRHFLFWAMDFNYAKDNIMHIYKGDLETGQIERIREGADPAYVEPGFLVFRLGTDRDVASIFAQRFDPARSVLSGQPVSILSNLHTPRNNAALSVTSRTLVFAQSMEERQGSPLLLSRDGSVLDSLAHRERAIAQRFSHDGRRVAFGFKDLWVHDLARNISERIPTEVTFPYHFAWSPDDSSIVYSATRVRGQLHVVQVARIEKEKTIFQSDAGNIESPEWSPDGRTILFVYVPDETRTHRELWACDVKKGTASPVLDGSFNVFEARFAPNGQWYAYTSDEGGDNSDVYLRSFPGPGAPIRVSAGGGAWPRWRKDGKELFYLNGEGYLVVVQVKFEGKPSSSQAKTVMADAIAVNPYNSTYPSFDVHPDGQRFLLRQDYGIQDFTQLTILRDWVGMLEERE